MLGDGFTKRVKQNEMDNLEVKSKVEEVKSLISHSDVPHQMDKYKIAQPKSKPWVMLK